MVSNQLPEWLALSEENMCLICRLLRMPFHSQGRNSVPWTHFYSPPHVTTPFFSEVFKKSFALVRLSQNIVTMAVFDISKSIVKMSEDFVEVQIDERTNFQ